MQKKKKKMRRKEKGPVVPAQDPVLIDCGIFETSLKTSESFLFKKYY